MMQGLNMLFSLVILLAAIAVGVQGQEGPQPSPVSAQEALFEASETYRLKFSEDSYTFNFPSSNAAPGPGGSTNVLSINSDPALFGTGVAQNLVTLHPCGLNQPHLHPRSTEISHVIKGTLLFGLVEENGGRVIVRNITAGETIFIPQGFLHFAQNLGNEEAQFIASFTNPDFGTLTINTNYFRFPTVTIAASLGISESDAAGLSQQALKQPILPTGPASCLQRIGGGGGYGQQPPSPYYG